MLQDQMPELKSDFRQKEMKKSLENDVEKKFPSYSDKRQNKQQGAGVKSRKVNQVQSEKKKDLVCYSNSCRADEQHPSGHYGERIFRAVSL